MMKFLNRNAPLIGGFGMGLLVSQVTFETWLDWTLITLGILLVSIGLLSRRENV
jgi:hypothetical protein